jgi:hypothetical protein
MSDQSCLWRETEDPPHHYVSHPCLWPVASVHVLVLEDCLEQRPGLAGVFFVRDVDDLGGVVANDNGIALVISQSHHAVLHEEYEAVAGNMVLLEMTIQT